MAPKYYFSTRDLLTIAILASLGGVMSTYVGYVANVINRLVGVPFGAGQVVAGLHILWIVLILAITGKKGLGRHRRSTERLCGIHLRQPPGHFRDIFLAGRGSFHRTRFLAI